MTAQPVGAVEVATALARAASATRGSGRVLIRIELTTVHTAEIDGEAYALGLASLTALGCRWGHEAAPGRAVWWAEIDPQRHGGAQ